MPFNIFKKKSVRGMDIKNMPMHIGIIMDGNGRWAKKRGLPRNVGHRAGANVLEKITIYADKIGLKYLTVYAFSTENWKRPKAEVDSLMELLTEYLSQAERNLVGKNIVIKIIGDLEPLSDLMKKRIVEIEEFSKNNTGTVLNIAINYGGQNEIVSAIKKIVDNNIPSENINEALVEKYLYTANTLPLDLIIRPSGEMRLSNFLIWQAAYAELWFDKILWPDFKEKDFARAINDYQNRNRRFGGV